MWGILNTRGSWPETVHKHRTQRKKRVNAEGALFDAETLRFYVMDLDEAIGLAKEIHHSFLEQLPASPDK